MNIQSITAAAYGSKIADLKRSDSRNTAPSPVPEQRSGETVEISATSSELSMLKGVIDALPEIRIKTVEDIQARIAINDYPIKNRMDEALKKMMLSGILNGE